MTGQVIELGLGSHQTGHTQAETLRSIVDRALVLLRDWLETCGDPSSDALYVEIEDCRAAMAAGVQAEKVEAMVLPCLDAGRSIVTQMQRQQVEGRNEMSTLVAIVREAVSAVATENRSLYGSLNQSTDRFAAVAQFNDIRQIKTQMVAEVAALKQVISARQQTWESSAALLSERVAGLERQLHTSRQEASLDALTNIANRRAFDQTLHEWMSPGRPGFVLGVFDIDGFKGINDGQGHAQGDRALVALAQTLKTSVRPQDVAARLGGDEFALLMSDLTLRQAEFRLKTIVAALAATPFAGSGDASFTLTVSCGVAEFSAGDTSASLLHRADEALYQAKHLGKNRVVAKASPFISDLLVRR